jgi:hypothetical protein
MGLGRPGETRAWFQGSFRTYRINSGSKSTDKYATRPHPSRIRERQLGRRRTENPEDRIDTTTRHSETISHFPLRALNDTKDTSHPVGVEWYDVLVLKRPSSLKRGRGKYHSNNGHSHEQ